MTLYILNYNNYYNRILKVENTLEDYAQFINHQIPSGNFNPNDGVNAQHVFGQANNPYDGTGDYLLVVNQDSEIVSRWFIIDAIKQRNGQYSLTLRRDLFADYYTDIINADMFIEKANLAVDNPLLFNSEEMTFNQIKTKINPNEDDVLLKDDSNCPWLVGYYSKGQQALTGTVATNAAADAAYTQLSTPIEEWDYYRYTNEDYLGTIQSAYFILSAETSETIAGRTISYSLASLFNNLSYRQINSGYGFNTSLFIPQSISVDQMGINYAQARRTWESNNNTNLNSYLQAYLGNRLTAEVNELLYYNGKTVKDSNGRLFDVTITTDSQTVNQAITSGNLWNAMKGIADIAGFYWYTAQPENCFELNATLNVHRIVLTERTDLTLTYEFGGDGKIITTDAPWNIFAIPCGETNVIINGTTITTNKNTAIDTAMAIQAQQGTNVYDIQLLPYCPVPNLITVNKGELQCTSDAQYSYIKQGETPVGVIFNVEKSNFSLDIPFEILPAESNVLKKLNNECDKWRLCSPSYSSYFDFSVEKNNGITLFNVDCNYKPYTPYIHINPNFNGLYGYDDNSPRGLVLGGDFSLSQIINQWEQYQIQNKNYQLTFDRQIQNMEIKNNVSRSQEVIQAISGTMTGATAGALVGAKGGAVGAIAGAVVGGTMSAVGGALDYQMNELLRNEALDYTKDMFGYSLGNIQALPDTISKVSAFNPNNKVFPILEYYTCTTQEKKALLNKMAFNGMTTMVIDKIQNYLGNNWEYTIDGQTITSKGYIKGKLIRLDTVEEDFHIINAIAEEINKGVYIE